MESLPRDLVSEIISCNGSADILELIHAMTISRTFYNAALFSVRHITSKMLRFMPLQFALLFNRLETVDYKNIYITLRTDQIDRVRQLTYLRVANFLILDSQDIMADAIKILNMINLSRTNIVHMVPFAGSYRQLEVLPRAVEGIIIQENRFMLIDPSEIGDFTTPTEIMNYMTNLISTLQNIKYMNLPRKLFIANSYQLTFYSHYIDISNTLGCNNINIPHISTLLSNTKEFFRNADFGLYDPRQPPSQINLPLSVVLSHLDYMTHKMVRNVMSIYNWYNSLYREYKGIRTRIDPVIQTYFGDQIARKIEQQQFRFYNQPIDILHNLSILDFMMINEFNDTIYDLYLYELPNSVVNANLLTSLSQHLQNMSDVYINALSNVIPGTVTNLYRTDGSQLIYG